MDACRTRSGPGDVSAVLYAIHCFHLQEWALREDISIAQTRKDIRRQVLLNLSRLDDSAMLIRVTPRYSDA